MPGALLREFVRSHCPKAFPCLCRRDLARLPGVFGQSADGLVQQRFALVQREAPTEARDARVARARGANVKFPRAVGAPARCEIDRAMANRPKLSPAQRAVQVTFVLKGDLKNVQIAYLRVAKRLAQIRDEKLDRALGYDKLEDYAAARLGLQRSALYKYLQIYEWAREFHPGWLANRPKGFIPELSDAAALMWIEHQLKHGNPGADRRREIERLRAKALAGKLTDAEFREVRDRGRRRVPPLRALLAAERAVRRRATRVPDLPASVLDEIDALVAHIAGLLETTKHLARRR